MKSKILIAVFTMSIVLSSVTSAWSNPTEQLPAPPPTNVDRPVDNPTETNSSTTKASFACEAKEDLLLTVVKVEGKDDIAIFDWDEQHFSDRIEATEICEKAATKLQAYYDSGRLKNVSFASGKIAEKPLLCIQEVKEGQTLNGRSSGCIDTDEVLVTLDASQKAGEVLCDVIVDEKQKPQSCKITHRGDFTMRFRFGWLPF